MQTSSNKSSSRTVFNPNNLFFTPFRVWLFPGANLTQKNTKTVHINLQKKQCTKRNKGYSTSLSFFFLVTEVTCQDSLIIHRMSANWHRSNLYTSIRECKNQIQAWKMTMTNIYIRNTFSVWFVVNASGALYILAPGQTVMVCCINLAVP